MVGGAYAIIKPSTGDEIMIKVFADTLVSACNTLASVGNEMNTFSQELDTILRQVHSSCPNERIEDALRKNRIDTSDIADASLKMSVSLETIIGQYSRANDSIEEFCERPSARGADQYDAVKVRDISEAMDALAGVSMIPERS